MRYLRITLIQSAYNLRAYLRSARTVVLGVVMPVGLLVVLTWVFEHQGTILASAGHPISAAAFFAGGLTAYGLMLGTFTGVMVGVVSAREAGLLKRFRASPMPPGAYLFGQIVFNFLISVALVIVMMGIASIAYGLHVSLAALAAMADPNLGPRAEVMMSLRGPTPSGLSQTIAVLAAAPVVEGLVLVPDALIDLETPLWIPSPFTAMLLGSKSLSRLRVLMSRPCVRVSSALHFGTVSALI